MKMNTLKQKIIDDYKVEVPDYWENIENSIDKAEIKKNPNTKHSVPFYRYVAAIVSMAIIVTGGFFGVNCFLKDTVKPSEIPVTKNEQGSYIRIGKLGIIGTAKQSLERSYTFEEAYKESTFVVEAVITEWLGEIDQDGLAETTYFRAVIEKEYKNASGLQLDNFVLLQEGNSKWTYEGYPLFKVGDKLLLLLNQIDPIEYPEFCIEGENCFSIVGGQLSDMLIVESKDGNEVVLKRNLFSNYSDIDSLIQSDAANIIESVLSNDPVLSEAGVTYECAYSMDDLKNYMDSLNN